MMLLKCLTLFAFLSWNQAGPTSQKADELLADPYIDGTVGFSIQPPKGWQIVRQRLAEKQGVTLLRMVGQVGPTQSEEIVLRQTATTRDLPMNEMLKQMHADWSLLYNDIQVLSMQEQEIAGKPGGVLAATYEAEGLRWLMIEAIIQPQSQQYFVLLYKGPAQIRKTGEPLFYQVLGSFRLLADQVSQTELSEAMKAGAKFLDDLNKDQLHKAVDADVLLRLDLDGKPIGFVRVQQAPGPVKDVDGIRIQERAWMFESEGAIRRLQANIFFSDDLGQENWHTSVTTLLPAKGNNPAMLDAMTEEGVRTKDILVTSQETGLGAGVTENPALKLPKGYISRGLIRMLPRLLGDLSKPRQLAFMEFDHQRVGLIVRVLDLKGEAKLPTGASKGKCYRIDQREGLSGQTSEWYVDQEGHILLIKAANMTMTPTQEKEMEALFKDRIAKAGTEMDRLEKEYNDRRDELAPKRKPPEKVTPPDKTKPGEQTKPAGEGKPGNQPQPPQAPKPDGKPKPGDKPKPRS